MVDVKDVIQNIEKEDPSNIVIEVERMGVETSNSASMFLRQKERMKPCDRGQFYRHPQSEIRHQNEETVEDTMI